MPENMEENCPFCQIVRGDIPSKKVLENNDFLAILDIKPAVPGHTIVIPKNHYFVSQQIPPDESSALGVFIKKVSSKLIQSLDFEGTTVNIANGGGAGQQVPHITAHVIPRNEGDDLGMIPEFSNQHKEEQKKILKKMKEAIGR